MSTGNYDTLSWFYERHWGPGFRFYDFAMDALEPILLRELRGDARILDLCCGAGHIVAALSERGYLVVRAGPSGGPRGADAANAGYLAQLQPGAREFSTA